MNTTHLAAVTALSVIKDPWLEQWPGGVYNGGFTRQWLEERDADHLHAHFGTNGAQIAMLAHIITGISYSFTAHANPAWSGSVSSVNSCP